jgi:hypothetical protein
LGLEGQKSAKNITRSMIFYCSLLLIVEASKFVNELHKLKHLTPNMKYQMISEKNQTINNNKNIFIHVTMDAGFTQSYTKFRPSLPEKLN